MSIAESHGWWFWGSVMDDVDKTKGDKHMAADRDKLVVGDTVRLNSGSPALTVVEVIGDKAKVTWTKANDDDFGSAEFPTACLTLQQPAAPSST